MRSRAARLELHREEIRGGERKQEQRTSLVDVRTTRLITLHVSMPHNPQAGIVMLECPPSSPTSVSAHGVYVAGHRKHSPFGREPESVLKFPRLPGASPSTREPLTAARLCLTPPADTPMASVIYTPAVDPPHVADTAYRRYTFAPDTRVPTVYDRRRQQADVRPRGQIARRAFNGCSSNGHRDPVSSSCKQPPCVGEARLCQRCKQRDPERTRYTTHPPTHPSTPPPCLASTHRPQNLPPLEHTGPRATQRALHQTRIKLSALFLHRICASSSSGGARDGQGAERSRHVKESCGRRPLGIYP